VLGVLVLDLLRAGLNRESPWESLKIPMGNVVRGTPLPPQLEAKIQQKSGMGVFLGVLVVDLLCAGLKLQSPWESYRIPMGIFGFISHFRATLAPFLKVWEAS